MTFVSSVLGSQGKTITNAIYVGRESDPDKSMTLERIA